MNQLLILLVAFYSVTLSAAVSCSENYGGCDKTNGFCWEDSDTPGSSYCSCKSGYRLDNGVKGKCVDVNECTLGLHDCDTINGRCVNLAGRYICWCNCDYTLDYTKTKCLLASAITGICTKFPTRKCISPTTKPTTTTASGWLYGRRRYVARRRRIRWDASKHEYDNEYTDELDDEFENDFEFGVDHKESEMLKLLDVVNQIKNEKNSFDVDDSFYDSDFDEDKRKKRSVVYGKGTTTYTTFHPPSCHCDIGYSTNACGRCQDINECTLGIHNCSDICQNTDGGYYCLCNPGKVLGPCGFKCYETARRPQTCNPAISTSFLQNSTLAYSHGITPAQLLNGYTNTLCTVFGRVIKPIPLKYYRGCTLEQLGKTVNESIQIGYRASTSVVVRSKCTLSQGLYIWIIQGVENTMSVWGPWTCWQECKATCSGGVQIRTRKCLQGTAGYGNCTGPSLEKKTCYSGPRCKPLIRKNVDNLTNEEKSDLRQAMTKYKADLHSTYGFHAAAGTHQWPLQCRAATGGNGGCCYHGAKLNFLAWHRVEVKNFEMGLTRYLRNKTLGLPYWDWLNHRSPPAFIWDKTIDGTTASNPFASMTIRLDSATPAMVQRSDVFNEEISEGAYSTFFSATYKMMRSNWIHEFSESLENSHNAIHTATCFTDENCQFSMAGLAYAAFDPFFMFHHSNVDRLFAIYQRNTELANDTSWTRETVLEPQENIYHFNEAADPFRNRSLTPWISMRRVNTMKDVYHYEELMNYKYDSMNISTSSNTTQAMLQSQTEFGNDELYAAQYQRNMGADVVVRFFYAGFSEQLPNFTSCSEATTDGEVPAGMRFLGEQLILGTPKEKQWTNCQPTLTLISRLFNEANIDFRFQNHDVVGCTTDSITCVGSCSSATAPNIQQLPTPQQVFFPRFTGSRHFRFHWADHVIFPSWQIDLQADTDFVLFTGPERNNIVLYRTVTHYNKCNMTQSAEINCAHSVCALPQASYFFGHKTKEKCLQGMKLRLLSKL